MSPNLRTAIFIELGKSYLQTPNSTGKWKEMQQVAATVFCLRNMSLRVTEPYIAQILLLKNACMPIANGIPNALSF
jgi:hypothetical protein